MRKLFILYNLTDAVMKEALHMGNIIELHQYAKSLLEQKRLKNAFDVFKLNYDKNPNIMTTNVGLARGYSAIGDYQKALRYMKAALPQVPNPSSKTLLEGLI